VIGWQWRQFVFKIGQMNRREFIGAVASSVASAENAWTQSRTRPNIVFVLTDDQGYGDIAAHGNPVIKTPSLDRLHDESVRFTDFHVSPTCAPTRTAVMTGRHEFRSGVTHTIFERERMSLKATTIAQVLKSAGYRTGIFGKWHLGDEEPYQPQNRGFEETFIHGCGGIGQDYPGTCADAPGSTYFDPVIRHNGRFQRTKGYCTDVFFEQALSWIEARKDEASPFFAYITPNAPHVPLVCPEEYRRMYKGLNLDEDTQKYLGMCTNIDDNVGKLVNRLTHWDIEKNTLLIFMTDNGGTSGVKIFNAGMRGAKATPYQGGTRVPAFFRWPGTLEPGERRGLAAHVDLFSTLAELGGASVPADSALDGRSLATLLRSPRASWPDRYLFTHVGRWDKGKAESSKYAKCRVRNQRFSMVNSGLEKRWELYDLIEDPGERRDISGQQSAIVSQMEQAYDRWWAEVSAALVNENAEPPRIAPYKKLYFEQYGGGPGSAFRG
jgi:arylsulfatase A-like enzyme